MNESSTISVIERDNLTREMLSRWIDSAQGFRCVGGYADTRSALQHLSEENPDLILVDLHLPGAIEYVRHLKPLLPGTGFVMLTDRADEETGVLVERLKFMDKAPRLALTWGTCRKPRRCLARKVPPAPPAR